MVVGRSDAQRAKPLLVAKEHMLMAKDMICYEGSTVARRCRLLTSSGC